MSTRCQIIVKDGYDEIWFYRHSDGYPDGVKETLNQFLSWVKEGKIRNNAEQAAGWLIILGNQEYKVGTEPKAKDGYGWKVGAYEPSAPKKHGDIEYLYTVDLEKKQISSYLIKETPVPTHIGIGQPGEHRGTISFLSDGIICIYNVIYEGGRRGSAIEVLKMRGEKFKKVV